MFRYRPLLMIVIGLAIQWSFTVHAEPAAEAVQAKAEGDRLAASGDVEAAIEAYNRSLSIEPDYALARNELGTALFRLGRLEDAIEEFRRAISIDESYAIAWFNLAFSSSRAERFEDAASAYGRYTELRPDEPDAWYGLAVSLQYLGRTLEAADAFDQYAGKEKRSERSNRIERARALAEQLREVEREEGLRSSIADSVQDSGTAESAPESREVRDELHSSRSSGVTPPVSGPTGNVAVFIAEGDAWLSSGEPARAVDSFERARGSGTENVEVLYKLGMAYARAGRNEEAISMWERVLELSPSNHGARWNIQTLRTRDTESTRGHASSRLDGSQADDNRNAVRQIYQSGIDSLRAGDYESALRTFLEVQRLDPGLVQARLGMASALVGMRRYGDARMQYESALRERPDMAAPLFGIAETYRALGNMNQARSFYHRYLDSNARDKDKGLEEQARHWIQR